MNFRRDREREVLDAQALKEKIDGIQIIRANIDRKSKFNYLNRCMNNKRREEEDEARNKQVKEHAALLQAKIEQEQQLVTEIDEVRRSELNALKKRQLLRQNSEELRTLETKLRAAYVAKQQISQMAEKEAKKLNEKLKEKECYSLLQSAWMDEEENRVLNAQEDIRRKSQYRHELHDQMIAQEKNRRFEYEEFLREKKVLDDIVQRIHDENERAIEERMCKMKKTQQEIDAFKAAQEIWRKKQKVQLEEENRKIQEYLLSKAAESGAIQEAKEKMEAARATVIDKMAEQLYEVQRARREKEDLLIELMEEEKKEESEKKHKVEVEKELRQRVETRVSLMRQMAEHKEQQKQQLVEDAVYKEQLIAKIAEDERLEQLSNDKRRRKMLEVRKEVERMITEKRQRYAEQMQLEAKILEQQRLEESERLRLVQEERIKMLKDHAHNLIGYLPKGILQEDDLPYLGSTVIDQYGGQKK